VAVAGLAVVAFLLLWPISTLGPGDHETKSCGNALSLDLSRWRVPSDGDYWERAYRACTTQRVDRLAECVAVVSLTALLTLVLALRSRRPGKQAG
jgi:hypothetical protein